MSDLQRLCYCSRARGGHGDNVPHDLASIVIQGRRFNHAHHVTGHLSYRQGSYLQVIEGPTEVINDLYERIRRDPRHCDVTTIVREFNVPDRIFHDWGLQLASGQRPDASLDQYLRANQETLLQLDRDGKRLLKPFFRFERAVKNDSGSRFPSAENVADYEFRLSAAPLRLDRLDRLTDRMDIVALLLRRRMSFRLLCHVSAQSSEFVYETIAHPLLRDVIRFRKLDDAEPEGADQTSSNERHGESQTPTLYGELKSMFARFLGR